MGTLFDILNTKQDNALMCTTLIIVSLEMKFFHYETTGEK